MMRFALLTTFLMVLCDTASADARIHGALPRQDDRTLETIPGVSSVYGDFETSDGYRLRTILTRPENARGTLPAVQFIQWLSCDSIEIGGGNDGWTQMLRGLVRGGPYAVLRVDKAGVGDSEGPDCSRLDYETELGHHREALAHLKRLDGIDADRIVVFGASMGATMAPLVAADHDVAGIVAWGGGAKSWFERLLAFDRHALELGDTPAADINPEMARRAAFHHAYLIEGRSPERIAADDPVLGKVWDRIIGTGDGLHYGRPIAFHQQAQRQNWPAAWAQVSAPVLALYGEYDWFETESGHRTIVRAVDKAHPGNAQLHVIPHMDHHFTVFPDALAAFSDQNGTANAEPVLAILVPWLHRALAISEDVAKQRGLGHTSPSVTL